MILRVLFVIGSGSLKFYGQLYDRIVFNYKKHPLKSLTLLKTKIEWNLK